MHGTIDITDIANSQVIEPAILYFGTPVVLIGSTNEDGSPNLAPMSSAWWVGWRCMLGLASNSKSTENMIRTGECVARRSGKDYFRPGAAPLRFTPDAGATVFRPEADTMAPDGG